MAFKLSGVNERFWNSMVAKINSLIFLFNDLNVIFYLFMLSMPVFSLYIFCLIQEYSKVSEKH